MLSTQAQDAKVRTVDGYLEWREESLLVEKAYRCWQCSSEPGRHLAFEAYAYALDREEAAAARYGELASLTEAVW